MDRYRGVTKKAPAQATRHQLCLKSMPIPISAHLVTKAVLAAQAPLKRCGVAACSFLPGSLPGCCVGFLELEVLSKQAVRPLHQE
eukprot:scaffold131306_cov20-Tisochrysis_lutea.AAC.6